VYPRKSNFSFGRWQTRVLFSFTVNFSLDIIVRIAAIPQTLHITLT
jgi:hypothetical protein